jgi:1-acyl-sn-glycerol-3-phosphate acyltransferase
MRKISTLFMYLQVALTIPFGYAFVMLVHFLITPFDANRHFTHMFVIIWCHTYLHTWPGWNVKVINRNLIPKGRCIIVANHQSMADILAIMGLREQFKFVSKASLFKVPFFGFIMKQMQYVSIERTRVPSMQEMMIQCRKLLDKNQRLVIFPEGTYGPKGKLLPFKRGAFKLAIEKNVPIVPVVIKGTRELIDGDGPNFEPKCEVTIEVKDPILPSGTDEELTKLVQAKFEHWLSFTSSSTP